MILIIISISLFNFALLVGIVREQCEADIRGAQRLLRIQRHIREGDETKALKYIDTHLKYDLNGIVVCRKLYIRPKRSMKVAGEIVDYFDTYREGQVEFSEFNQRLNDDLRYMSEEIREQELKQVEQTK